MAKAIHPMNRVNDEQRLVVSFGFAFGPDTTHTHSEQAGLEPRDIVEFDGEGSQFTTGAAANPMRTIVVRAIHQADQITSEMESGN